MRDILLLTATVTPNTGELLKVVDPDVRRSQYRSAIADWLEAGDALGFELHVVETSGASADELLTQVTPAARCLVTFGNVTLDPSVQRRGKGAMELSAISSYAKDSGLFAAPGCVYKVTGRLTVSNSIKCIAPLGPTQVRLRMSLNRTYADTRLLGAGTEVWPGLIDAAMPHVDDSAGLYLEHAVAAHVASAAALRELDITRFPERPHFVGTSGSFGKKYGSPLATLASPLMNTLDRGLAWFAGRKSV